MSKYKIKIASEFINANGSKVTSKGTTYTNKLINELFMFEIDGKPVVMTIEKTKKEYEKDENSISCN